MADKFKFNFQPAVAEDADELQDEPSYDSLDRDDDPAWAFDPATLMPSEEVTSGRHIVQHTELEEVDLRPGLTLLKGRISGAEAAALLKDQQVASSDLLTGVYEGGFKLWEGSIDLCNYLIERYHINPSTLLTANSSDTDLQGKRVLELGCGHGLPGILALIAGAEVHFQDYNKEVLTSLTIPNVVANLARLPAGRQRGTAKYFSGDWHRVGEILTSRQYGGYYDLVITAESIYNVNSQHRLIECIKQVLQPPLGVVLVAAKSFYFGVGGGIQSFQQAVKRDGIFEWKSVYRTTKDVFAGAIRPALGSSAAAAGKQQEAQEAAARAAAAAAAQKEQPPEEADYVQGKQQSSPATSDDGDFINGTATDPSSGSSGADSTGNGGNVREIIQLTFPEAILPYFL